MAGPGEEGRIANAGPGRPPLSDEAVAARVAAYCRRYGVVPSPNGLPPFPSGQRETAQHREWLVVYRAVKRLAARRANPAPDAKRRPHAVQGALACAVCGDPVTPGDESARELRLGRASAARVRLHRPCAELAERARQAGPDALARVAALLWPRRAS